jgi:hypothetical protein
MLGAPVQNLLGPTTVCQFTYICDIASCTRNTMNVHVNLYSQYDIFILVYIPLW